MMKNSKAPSSLSLMMMKLRLTLGLLHLRRLQKRIRKNLSITTETGKTPPLLTGMQRIPMKQETLEPVTTGMQDLYLLLDWMQAKMESSLSGLSLELKKRSTNQ